MTAGALDFRLPDWVVLDMAVARFTTSYGNRELGASELFRAMVFGRLAIGLVSNPPIGPPARYVAPPEFWRQFGGIYADRDGKPRFLPVPQGVGGCVAIPVERRIFYARVADIDKLCPLPGSMKQEMVMRVAASTWAREIAKRLKADNKIPEGITQNGFAEMIARQMQKEVADNPSLGKPPTQAHIRRRLKEWGLRPPKLN